MQSQFDSSSMILQIAELAPFPGEPQTVHSHHSIEHSTISIRSWPVPEQHTTELRPDRVFRAAQQFCANTLAGLESLPCVFVIVLFLNLETSVSLSFSINIRV